MDTGVLSLVIKRPGRKANRSPPHSAGLRMRGAIPSVTHRLHKRQGQLYPYLSSLYLCISITGCLGRIWKVWSWPVEDSVTERRDGDREVLGSNIGPEIGYLEVSRGFPQSHLADSKMSHDRFANSSFVVIVYFKECS
jgi:hypothetical protein